MNAGWAEKKNPGFMTTHLEYNLSVGQNPCLQLQGHWRVGGGSSAPYHKTVSGEIGKNKANM